MIQFFWRRQRPSRLVVRPLVDPQEPPAGDYLAHPALKRMRPEELADIPFPRPPCEGGRI